MPLIHDFCQCGHDKRVHGVFGQVCVGCDCAGFSRERVWRDRGPRVAPWLRRLVKHLEW